MTKLIGYDGGSEIPTGGAAYLDGNYPVTVVEITPPYDDADPGEVTIRHSWGETETVPPGRLAAYID